MRHMQYPAPAIMSSDRENTPWNWPIVDTSPARESAIIQLTRPLLVNKVVVAPALTGHQILKIDHANAG